MEKLNIAELLKDCPKGMELDCTMYDKVTLIRVDNEKDTLFPIKVLRQDGCGITLTKYGQYADAEYAKCVIFPKGKTTWEGFPRPFEDGDVVATIDGTWVGITLGGKVGEFIPTYCVIDSHNEFMAYFERKQEWLFHRLATEEEKQKLFKAIKDNGYKWNAETKTLEKLIEPKFKVGDRVLWNYDTETPRTILEVKLTSKGGYVYWINCEGCTSGWWDETELTPIPNKFDITTLKPFDKVLVRDYDTHNWRCALYDRYVEDNMRKFATIIGHYTQCIPYESNEHLLGTTNDCDDYYKNWE